MDDVTYWKEARESFNDLSQLTREVDNYMSALVLLSVLNNFFSICIQLQHTVRRVRASLFFFVTKVLTESYAKIRPIHPCARA